MSLTLPPVSVAGFTLKAKGDQILLFHGFTGSPYDLRPLADFLHAQNFYVQVPLLPGHGQEAKDLQGVKYIHWLKAAKEALAGLDHNRLIIVGGLSMGALLAVMLAATDKNIAGLLLISPAFQLTFSAELTISGVKLGLIDSSSSLKKMSGGSDIAWPLAKKACPSLKEMPVYGLMEFEKLRLKAKSALKKISAPVFYAFGQDDGAINIGACRRILWENLSVPSVGKTYPRSKHIVSLDYDQEKLFIDIKKFLTSHIGFRS